MRSRGDRRQGTGDAETRVGEMGAGEARYPPSTAGTGLARGDGVMERAVWGWLPPARADPRRQECPRHTGWVAYAKARKHRWGDAVPASRSPVYTAKPPKHVPIR